MRKWGVFLRMSVRCRRCRDFWHRLTRHTFDHLRRPHRINKTSNIICCIKHDIKHRFWLLWSIETLFGDLPFSWNRIDCHCEIAEGHSSNVAYVALWCRGHSIVFTTILNDIPFIQRWMTITLASWLALLISENVE